MLYQVFLATTEITMNTIQYISCCKTTLTNIHMSFNFNARTRQSNRRQHQQEQQNINNNEEIFQVQQQDDIDFFNLNENEKQQEQQQNDQQQFQQQNTQQNIQDQQQEIPMFNNQSQEMTTESTTNSQQDQQLIKSPSQRSRRSRKMKQVTNDNPDDQFFDSSFEQQQTDNNIDFLSIQNVIQQNKTEENIQQQDQDNQNQISQENSHSKKQQITQEVDFFAQQEQQQILDQNNIQNTQDTDIFVPQQQNQTDLSIQVQQNKDSQQQNQNNDDDFFKIDQQIEQPQDDIQQVQPTQQQPQQQINNQIEFLQPQQEQQQEEHKSSSRRKRYISSITQVNNQQQVELFQPDVNNQQNAVEVQQATNIQQQENIVQQQNNFFVPEQLNYQSDKKQDQLDQLLNIVDPQQNQNEPQFFQDIQQNQNQQQLMLFSDYQFYPFTTSTSIDKLILYLQQSYNDQQYQEKSIKIIISILISLFTNNYDQIKSIYQTNQQSQMELLLQQLPVEQVIQQLTQQGNLDLALVISQLTENIEQQQEQSMQKQLQLKILQKYNIKSLQSLVDYNQDQISLCSFILANKNNDILIQKLLWKLIQQEKLFEFQILSLLAGYNLELFDVGKYLQVKYKQNYETKYTAKDYSFIKIHNTEQINISRILEFYQLVCMKQNIILKSWNQLISQAKLPFLPYLLPYEQDVSVRLFKLRYLLQNIKKNTRLQLMGSTKSQTDDIEEQIISQILQHYVQYQAKLELTQQWSQYNFMNWYDHSNQVRYGEYGKQLLRQNQNYQQVQYMTSDEQKQFTQISNNIVQLQKQTNQQSQFQGIEQEARNILRQFANWSINKLIGNK